MSWFSRIRLDPAHPDARGALLDAASDVYAEHQWLWRFFPAERGAVRDFLFRRMEPGASRAQAEYYTVSARAPQAPHPAWRVESRLYHPQLRAGERLSFQLRVNPVRTVRESKEDRGRRHDVVMHAKKLHLAQRGLARWAELGEDERPPLYRLAHEAVSEWFAAPGGIADRHGLRVDPSGLQIDAYRQHRLPKRGAAKEIRFSSVDLQGEATVEAPEAASKALLQGIGHAKGFGCGLLLVRRLE